MTQSPIAAHQPQFLGQRDEAHRRHQAMLRVLPAHQRLGADDAAAAQIDLGLVMQHEFAALRRAAQLRTQCQPLVGLAVELGRAEQEGCAGLHTRLGGGEVGAAAQRIDRSAVARRHRDADPGLRDHLVQPQQQGLGGQRHHLLGGGFEGLDVGHAFEQQAEVVGAQSADTRRAVDRGRQQVVAVEAAGAALQPQRQRPCQFVRRRAAQALAQLPAFGHVDAEQGDHAADQRPGVRASAPGRGRTAWRWAAW